MTARCASASSSSLACPRIARPVAHRSRPAAAAPRLPLARTLHRHPRAALLPTAPRPLHGAGARRTMASDDAYGAFLDQANQDVSGGGGAATATAGKKANLQTVDRAVPARLKSLDAYYTSDADEPFEPVSLGFAGKTLDESMFSRSRIGWAARAYGLRSPQNRSRSWWATRGRSKS